MKTNRLLSIVFILVSSVFADTVYLRNGQEVKDAVVTEVGIDDVKYKIGKKTVVYTVRKSDIATILYADGTKEVFEAEPQSENAIPAETAVAASQEDPPDSADAGNSRQSAFTALHIVDFGAAGGSYIIGGSYNNITFGLGVGFESPDDNGLLFILFRYEFYKKWFFGSKIGIGEYQVFNPFVGFLFDRWSFALGWNFFHGADLPDDVMPITLKAGYQFKTTFNKEEYDNSSNDLHLVQFGLGADITLWQKENELNNRNFPTGGGFGLFSRIFYFKKWLYWQPGIYYHFRSFEKETPLSEFIDGTGLDYAIPDFIDNSIVVKSTYDSHIIEIPVLFGIGIWQIKFALGLLPYYYISNNISVSMNLNTPFGNQELFHDESLIITEKIYEKYYSEWGGWGGYLVFGFDMDITEHFGIGGKYLFTGRIETSSHFRTSAYFIF